MIKGLCSNHSIGLVYQHGVYYATCARLTKHKIQLLGYHQGVSPNFPTLQFAKIAVCIPYAMVDVYVHHYPSQMCISSQIKLNSRQSSFYCGWKHGQEVWSSMVVDEWQLQDYLQIFSNRFIKIHIIDVDVHVLWHLVYWYVVEHAKLFNIVLALYQHAHGVYGLIGRNDSLWTVIDAPNLDELWSQINLQPHIVLSLNIENLQLELYTSSSIQFMHLNHEKDFVMSTALALRGLYA
jgi:hypothetical protein